MWSGKRVPQFLEELASRGLKLLEIGGSHL
jgi:hypothetical protein